MVGRCGSAVGPRISEQRMQRTNEVRFFSTCDQVGQVLITAVPAVFLYTERRAGDSLISNVPGMFGLQIEAKQN